MDKRMNFFIFVNLFVQSIVMHNNVSSNCWIKSKIENVGLFLVKKINIGKSAYFSLNPCILTPDYQRGLDQILPGKRLVTFVTLVTKRY